MLSGKGQREQMVIDASNGRGNASRLELAARMQPPSAILARQHNSSFRFPSSRRPHAQLKVLCRNPYAHRATRPLKTDTRRVCVEHDERIPHIE